MESAIIIIGTVFIWLVLALVVKNQHIKNVLIMAVVMLTYALSYVLVIAQRTGFLDAVILWRSLMFYVVFIFIFLFGAFWVVNTIKKEDIDNDI